MRPGRTKEQGPITWPNGRAFAFTIFDDTDWTTLENGPLVYDFLTGLGFRITKSVWPSATIAPRTTGGGTCADTEYLRWVLSLQSVGHEIGYHNATDHPSLRDETRHALETFRELFGTYPKVGADHGGNSEALYWGPRRLSGWRSGAYSLIQRLLQPNRPQFSGEDPTSRFFWGDLCQQHVTYWRNFAFAETNTLRACPKMPYHDPDRPYVNHYFAATNAPRRDSFLKHASTERIDQLEAQSGACIMYTHFGVDFVVDGALDPAFVDVMTRLSQRNGWFVPVSDVLDTINSQKPSSPFTDKDRRRLEHRWMVDRLRNSRRFGPRVITTTGRP